MPHSSGRQRVPPPATAPPRWAVQAGYAVVGLLIGGTWLLGGSLPVWEHVLRLLVVLVVVPPLVHLARGRLYHVAHPPLRHLVAAKAGLVAVALVLDLLLAHWTARPELVTACALAAAVAAGGPLMHRRLTPAPAPGDR